MIDLGALKISIVVDTDEAKKGLDKFSKSTEKVADSFDPVEKAAKDVSKTITQETQKATKEIQKAEAENENYSDSFQPIGDAAKDSTKTIVSQVKDTIKNIGAAIKQNAEHAKSFLPIGKRAKEANKEIKDGADKSKKSLKEQREEIKKTKEEIDKLHSAITGPITTGLKTLAGLFTGLTASMFGVVEGSKEFREEQNKLQTAFENTGKSSDDAANTFQGLYNILGDTGQATEASAHLAKLCDDSQELAQWVNICAGVYGSFGDSLPIEGLTEAANETSKTGQLTGVLADAIQWAGIKEDDFQAKLDTLSTEQERNSYILSTLNGLYSEAADNFNKNSQQAMEANAANLQLKQSVADLGTALEPTTTDLKEMANDGIKALADYITDNQEDIDNLVDKIKEFGNFVMNNKDAIISGLTGIGIGLAVFKVASIISSCVTAIKGFKTAVEGATTSQAVFNAVMNANPIIAIVSIILAVVGAIVTFIATNDEARAKILEVWEGIKTKISDTIDKIKEFFSNLWETIKEWFKSIPDRIKQFAADFKEAAINLFNKIKEGFQKVWDTIVSWVTTAFTTVKDTIVGFGTAFYEAGKAIFTFLWDGIKNIWSSITGWVTEKINWLKDKLTFWKSGTDEMDTGDIKPAPSGSTAGRAFLRNGISSVPYDDYASVLHKGEMVLTANEAKRYKEKMAATGETNITVNNYSPKALTVAESAREYRKTQKKLSLGLQ